MTGNQGYPHNLVRGYMTELSLSESTHLINDTATKNNTFFGRWDKKVRESNTDINIFSLPSRLLQKCGSGYGRIGHNQLPIQSCIYFVVNKEEKIIYIGQADNLKRRFQNHLSKKRCFWDLECTIFWLIRDYSTQYKNDPLEAAFIRKYKPKLNIRIC